MYATEEEAAGKQCRQCAAALVPTQSQGAIALHTQQHLTVGWGTCVGSKCMGWRWAAPPRSSDDGPRRGYCGFAGAPYAS